MRKCPLCNGQNLSVYTDKLRFDKIAKVLKCIECSLVFLDQSSFIFPNNFYESTYHQTYLTHVDPDILDPHKYYAKMQKVSAPWITRINNLLTGSETVLDIGCSTGHLITGIHGKAAKVYGSELSKKEVEFCKNILKIDVNNKPLSERFEKSSMDIITLIFVFEHIGSPVSFLEELKLYLKPEGKLIIVVPNILDPLISLYQIDELKNFYFCIEHLFYYSPATLTKILDQSGFSSSIELIQEYPITNHLNWMYTKKPSETLAARSHMPNVKIANDSIERKLGDFWHKINEDYKHLLLCNGYSDRIWCVAEKKHD